MHLLFHIFNDKVCKFARSCMHTCMHALANMHVPQLFILIPVC